MSPIKGPRPVIPTTDKLRYLISQLLNKPKPVLYESDEQYDLTMGQVELLQKSQITFIMSDDLGKYELVLGPDRHIVKRRL